VAIWIGAGGAAFMIANLLLAGLLGSEDFGRLALFEAVVAVSVGLGPVGLDTLVVRRELSVNSGTLWRAVWASSVVALVASFAGTAVYGLESAAVALLVVTCLAAAVSRMSAAHEQSVIRLTRSQLIAQVPKLVFAMGALFLTVAEIRDWRAGAATLVFGYVTAGCVGLVIVRPELRAQRMAASDSVSAPGRLWRKSLAFTGILASLVLLGQVERLVIARVMSLEDLAVFAVAATVVGSPYRLLQGGIGYAFMPRLRQASRVLERRNLVWGELMLAGFLGVGGGVLLTVFARPLIEALYGGRYRVTFGLVVAIVFAGLVRLGYGVASAAVSALGGLRQLRWFNLAGWLGTAVAVFSAVLLSAYGLVGVVVGGLLGWIVRLTVATALVRPHLTIGHLGVDGLEDHAPVSYD
jgi:O-antigen/teichoic acid export membrane protein